MPSIYKNFLYNLLLTLSTYLFGLIVFPYVTRVLGVDNFGKINFVDQIIRYIMLFAAMGIGTVGVREIASCGDDREKRSQIFSDIFSFILILMSASVVVLLILALTVPRFADIKNLLVIGSLHIIGTTFLIEWFYQGMENFRYVTLRTVIVKVFYVAAVFIFVKDEEDYIIYYLIGVITICVNALINIYYSRKFVDFSFKKARVGKYMKPIISLGVYQIMLSFFTTFNVLYLGFAQDNYAVGIYSTSIKIYSIILGGIFAFTSVMMPRMSSLLTKGCNEDFDNKISISFELVFSTTIPLAIGGVILAPQIISLLAGAEYMDAVLPMQIIMPNIFIISCAQIWVIQMLLPMKKDRLVSISSICAAIVGIALNILLIGKLSFIGSAITLVVAELCGDAVSLIYVLKNKLLKLPSYVFFAKYLAAGAIYAGICLICSSSIDNNFASLFVAIALCMVAFIVLNCFVFKGGFIWSYTRKIVRHA